MNNSTRKPFRQCLCNMLCVDLNTYTLLDQYYQFCEETLLFEFFLQTVYNIYWLLFIIIKYPLIISKK